MPFSEASQSDLLVAVIAAIIVEFLLLLVQFGIYIRRILREDKHAKNFLKGWFKEAAAGVDELDEQYQIVLRNWKKYQAELNENPKADMCSPNAPYTRIHMPNITDVVIAASASMPEAAYVNLLHLNTKLHLLDERGERLSDFFDPLVFQETSNEGRCKMTKLVVEKLEYVINVVNMAKCNRDNKVLQKWLEYEIPDKDQSECEDD